jgi:hypothetical protein
LRNEPPSKPAAQDTAAANGPLHVLPVTSTSMQLLLLTTPPLLLLLLLLP